MRISDWSSDVCSSDLAVGSGQQFLDDRHGVVRVQDGKLRLQPRLARLFAQQLDAQRVKRADVQALGQLAVDQRLDALVHLSRCLFGEGQDRKSVVWGQSVSRRLDPGGCIKNKK